MTFRDLEQNTNILSQSQDAFNKLIADGTTNELDIASQYAASPERVRVHRNNTREFINYSSSSVFTDDPDVWRLQPGDGDNVRLESAESITYSVQYVVQASFAFKLNQSLQSGDAVKIGPYNGSDGWYIEHRGEHADDEVDIIRERAGSSKTLASDVKLDRPVTEFTRLECRYNWYNVGNQIWYQTYFREDDGEQINKELVKTGEKARGPQTANLNLWYEIDQGSGNTGAELVAGSCSAVTLGRIQNLTRAKGQYKKVTLPSGNDDTWVPIYAIRLDPDNDNTNAQLKKLKALQYSNAADVELLAVSVDTDKTDASGWTTPEYHHEYNSDIQETESVTEVPNSSGTQKVLTSGEKPGGFTLGTSVRLDAGGQETSAAEATDAREVKKSILGSDVVVFLARSGSSGGDVDFTYESVQNW